VTIAQDYPAKR